MVLIFWLNIKVQFGKTDFYFAFFSFQIDNVSGKHYHWDCVPGNWGNFSHLWNHSLLHDKGEMNKNKRNSILHLHFQGEYFNDKEVRMMLAREAAEERKRIEDEAAAEEQEREDAKRDENRKKKRGIIIAS